MIYKIHDWILENANKLNWGIIFVKCDKYDLIEQYWHHFIEYSQNVDIMFNPDLDIFPFDMAVEYMSENPAAFQHISSLPNLFWSRLSVNPAAIRLIEQNIAKADFFMLSKNPAAIHLLEKNFDKIDWIMLSQNPNAEKLLSNNIDLVSMYDLCSFNPNAVNIINIMLEKNPKVIDFLYWNGLSRNPDAISLLERFPEKICWDTIVCNPNAIHLIRNNASKINEIGWEILERSGFATDFFNEFPEKKVSLSSTEVRSQEIENLLYNETEPVFPDDFPFEEMDWDEISLRSKNMELLRKNKQRLDWHYISTNPNIYCYDYRRMKQNMDEWREELMMKALHPSRVTKWIELDCHDMLE